MLLNKHNSESGFTLVELLVVIAIIAILTAIAVPAFLNQRQKANDASVRSDMKNVVTEIETRLIDESGTIRVAYEPANGRSRIGFNGIYPTYVKLSTGVSVETPVDGTGSAYTLRGFHTNGGKYVSGSPLIYNSAAGGFTN